MLADRRMLAGKLGHSKHALSTLTCPLGLLVSLLIALVLVVALGRAGRLGLVHLAALDLQLLVGLGLAARARLHQATCEVLRPRAAWRQVVRHRACAVAHRLRDRHGAVEGLRDGVTSRGARREVLCNLAARAC